MFKFCPVPSVVGPLKQFGACFWGRLKSEVHVSTEQKPNHETNYEARILSLKFITSMSFLYCTFNYINKELLWMPYLALALKIQGFVFGYNEGSDSVSKHSLLAGLKKHKCVYYLTTSLILT